MAETKAQRAAADNAAQDEIEGTDGARGVADGIETAKDDATPKMKAYTSDRNLAEVNAGQVFYLDPGSEVGKRLVATGFLTEVDDPA